MAETAPEKDVSQRSTLLEASQKLVDAVSALRDELLETSEEYHRRRRNDRFKIVALCVLLVFAVFGGWYQSASNGRQLDILRSATDPNGEIYKRGQTQTACALLFLDNENRSIHDKPLLKDSDFGLDCKSLNPTAEPTGKP